MSDQPVVVTGMGWVTPLGWKVDEVWDRLVRGESAFGPVSRYEAATFATNFGSEVRDFDLSMYLGERAEDYANTPVATRFAIASATEAWVQAGLKDAGIDPRRIGIYMGAGEGKIDLPAFASTSRDAFGEGGLDLARWGAIARERFDGEAEAEQEPSMCLAHVAGEFQLRGPVGNCVTACAAGAQCVGEASELIRRGDADVMLAGGSHSMIHPLGMSGFIRLTAMSTRSDDPESASRPFDATRDGFVMGEGAGMLVLERLDHALARGATPLAEIAGYGSSADAYRITDIDPEGQGAAIAMRAALDQAGIDPAQRLPDGRPPVHWVNAHGTGTKENDRIETKSVKLVFGDMAKEVPFTSVKSMLGHLIQAAGTVELISCIKAIHTGVIPPTINYEHPDPACDLDMIPGEARDTGGKVDVCLSNSFGFGGQNDCVCVRRHGG